MILSFATVILPDAQRAAKQLSSREPDIHLEDPYVAATEASQHWIHTPSGRAHDRLIAAEAGRPVTTADLVEAAREEYREMGRII